MPKSRFLCTSVITRVGGSSDTFSNSTKSSSKSESCFHHDWRDQYTSPDESRRPDGSASPSCDEGIASHWQLAFACSRLIINNTCNTTIINHKQVCELCSFAFHEFFDIPQDTLYPIIFRYSNRNILDICYFLTEQFDRLATLNVNKGYQLVNTTNVFRSIQYFPGFLRSMPAAFRWPSTLSCCH